ncbi:MAG: TIGR04133 family radical SAM/SPASM protein [Treponema sp.]|nr:TIGR04133 family radical SAM/SPASM protein [Treponema sp.]
MYLPLWLKRFLFFRYRKHVIKNHRLDYLFWECTLRCNLSCLHCGSDCTKKSGESEMSVEDFAKVLDDIKERNPVKNLTVCITGGEPLVRSDLEDAGKEIVKRGFHWGIVTNGLLFSKERFVSLLNAGMTSLSFSLDGFENQHNYLRQHPESFEKVVSAIKMVIGFQKKYPGRIVYDIITCVHRGNLQTLREFRDFLIEMGVERWRIFSIFPEGRARENDLSLNPDEYRSLMDFIAETRSYKNQNGKSIHLNYSCEGYLGKYELKVRDYFFFCRGGISIGSVWCNGNVGACLSVRSPDLIQGNIYEEKFMDIWNNRFERMRNRNWMKIGKCAGCKKWKHCMGNGMHLHQNLTCEVDRCNYEIIKEGLEKVRTQF